MLLCYYVTFAMTGLLLVWQDHSGEPAHCKLAGSRAARAVREAVTLLCHFVTFALTCLSLIWQYHAGELAHCGLAGSCAARTAGEVGSCYPVVFKSLQHGYMLRYVRFGDVMLVSKRAIGG
jgi:L-asparaginase II